MLLAAFEPKTRSAFVSVLTLLVLACGREPNRDGSVGLEYGTRLSVLFVGDSAFTPAVVGTVGDCPTVFSLRDSTRLVLIDVDDLLEVRLEPSVDGHSDPHAVLADLRATVESCPPIR
jgi:hypothetical protein